MTQKVRKGDFPSPLWYWEEGWPRPTINSGHSEVPRGDVLFFLSFCDSPNQCVYHKVLGADESAHVPEESPIGISRNLWKCIVGGREVLSEQEGKEQGWESVTLSYKFSRAVNALHSTG